jgi:hypothetical protein
MATQKQIEANRANAKKSTGPKTPAGRAAVRLNSVKHGLCAKTLVLDGEQQSDFESLLNALESEHQPTTPTEQVLVRQIAMATWRLRRLYNMEAGFFNLRLDELDETIAGYHENLDDSGRLALVAHYDSSGAKTLTNLSRFEARLERTFYRALHELQRLRAQRPVKVEKQTQSARPVPEPVSLRALDVAQEPAPLPISADVPQSRPDVSPDIA